MSHVKQNLELTSSVDSNRLVVGLVRLSREGSLNCTIFVHEL